MKVRNFKKTIVFVLLLILCVSVSNAGTRIDDSKSLSLSVSINESIRNYSKSDITISLYKVGDIEDNGDYKSILKSVDFKSLNKDSSAKEIEKFIDLALSDEALSVYKSVTLSNSDVNYIFTNIERALYILTVETGDPIPGDTKSYSFSNMLIAVPNTVVGTTKLDENGNMVQLGDEFIYDVSINLKEEVEDLYGTVTINKNLVTNNVTRNEEGVYFYNPSFVYEVVAVDKDDTSKIVFDNVYAINYNKENSVETDKIPCNSIVTVKEIYSGADYSVVGQQEITGIGISFEASTPVDFTNDYNDGKKTGGIAVVNEFTSSNGTDYQWTVKN